MEDISGARCPFCNEPGWGKRSLASNQLKCRTDRDICPVITFDGRTSDSVSPITPIISNTDSSSDELRELGNAIDPSNCVPEISPSYLQDSVDSLSYLDGDLGNTHLEGTIGDFRVIARISRFEIENIIHTSEADD